MKGGAAGAIAATVIGAAIVGGCAAFCGTQLGWGHMLSIILLVVLGLCVCLLLFFIVKSARMKSHPVFRRYGSAAVLAQRINEGLRSPCYYAEAMVGNAPFTTLMTDEFIVSGVELVEFMELNDLRSVSVASFVNTHRIVVGDPLMTVASVAANRISDNVIASRGINSQTVFDQITFKDTAGKPHRYGVHRRDIESFFETLSRVAPHIVFEK